MSDSDNNDQPQVFAVQKQVGSGWQFNRRDFLKAAGAVGGAAGLSAAVMSAAGRASAAIPLRRQNFQTGLAHNGSIQALALAKDDLLASGSVDQTIKLWSLPDGALVKTVVENGGQIAGLAL